MMILEDESIEDILVETHEIGANVLAYKIRLLECALFTHDKRAEGEA